MAEKVLIMGESGTGKSTSLRNLNPDLVAVVNPVGKPLPFRGAKKFATLDSVVDSYKIKKWMKEQAAAGKKIIVVDDFQYILSVPYMNRIKENGWDKWNDFGANYFEIIEVCKELPDDVVVYYMTHTETLDNGITTIKLIGKLLREKITIEGLFTIVLRTLVSEGKYFFLTQNSGNDTVKSPLGMFPDYAIDNDLQYVDDKIRNYYEFDAAKSDAEMAEADKKAKGDIEKPDARGRRSRTKKADAEAKEEAPAKTHDQVEAENKAKMDQYMADCDKALDEAFPGQEEVPFDEACAVRDTVPKPELEKVPRRTRKERTAKAEADAQAEAVTEPEQEDEAPVKVEPNSGEATTPGRTRRVRRTRG